MIFLKRIGNFFLSLKEVLVMMMLQFSILILSFVIFGGDKAIIWSSIFFIIIQLIYIVIKCKNIKISFRSKKYFPYFLLGIGVATVLNMIIFKIETPSEVTTDYPIILNILCSGIIGPIFEEFLFRYDLIRRLSKFNSNRWIIVILSSIIFGLCHTGITTIIYAFIIGIINSYIYMKDKDIIKPIIIHMAGNIFVNFLYSYNLTTLILGIILIVISYFIIKCNKIVY